MYQTRIQFTAALVICSLVTLLLGAAVSRAYESSGDIAERVVDEQLLLEDIRSEAAIIDMEIASWEQELDKKRNQLADARLELEEAEERYHASLLIYDQRLASIYKLGEHQVYAILLSSDDFSDASARITYLVDISANDIKLIERVKAEAAEVRQLHERIDNLKQETAGSLDDLLMRRQELVTAADESETALNDLTASLAETEAREAAEALKNMTGSSTYEVFYGGITDPSALIIASEPPPGLEPTGVVLSGVASWYGPGFHTRKTANSETYDMHAYTAAHKTLPFNTWLRVTYDGRTVFVRVNDRGPYIGGRFLDLSLSSARALGLSGIGYVTAEVYR